MRYRLQILTLVHLVIALFTMLRAQAASLGALGLCLVVVLGTTFFPDRFAFASLQRKGLRTALIALVVGASVLRGVELGELITPGVDLLLLLIAERCLFRDRLREQIQLLLLASMVMVIAGVVHVGVDYPLLLAGFVLAAIAHWGLWNLEREAERIGARAQYALAKHGQVYARQIIRQNIRLGLGVLVIAGGVFLFFPRIGAGVFFRGNRASGAQAGFRDEVSLGHRGDIANNPTVVARVYPESSKQTASPTLDLYFRVSAFDRYRDGRWAHSEQAHKLRLRSSMHRYYLPFTGSQEGQAWGYLKKGRDGQVHLSRLRGWRDSGQVTQLRILQNDLGARHLMVPGRTAVLEWMPRGALERRTRLVSDYDGQVKIVGTGSGSMQFRAYARSVAPSGAELRSIGRPSYGQRWAPYLQLPADLRSSLHRFSYRLKIDEARVSQYELMHALVATLSSYRYTTQSQTPSKEFAQRDPIEAFLLDTKAGHCEYFASALALLARSHGLPARVVNGYYGAHRNPIDGTYQISQSQAHAWVEIYFSKLGWIRFDATPPSERPSAPPRESWWVQARSLFQALETKYLEYVVDYDGKKQWNAVKGLRRSGPVLSKERMGWVAGALVGLVFCVVAWKRRPSVGGDGLLRAQLRVRDRLQQLGLEIGAQENVISWARRAQEAGMDPSGRLYEIIRESEVLRFSPAQVKPEQVQTALTRLRGLLRGLCPPVL